MTFRSRHSICDEAFENWPFAHTCKVMCKAGYTRIEIDLFTLAEIPGDVTAAQRNQYRDVIQSEGVTFTGLHWLMVSTKGLRVTGSDPELRRRSWEHIFGSPNHADELAAAAPNAENRGYDFKPVFRVLSRRGYAGWISLEAFDFTPGAERLVNKSLRHLESEIESLI